MLFRGGNRGVPLQLRLEDVIRYREVGEGLERSGREVR